VSNFGKALFILFVCNFSALGITPQTDTFDGGSLNPIQWSEAFLEKTNKGTSFFNVANGRLNFHVTESTIYNTENSRIIENKSALPFDKNWILKIGLHNSASFSSASGSSQLKLLITDSNYDFNYGLTLAKIRNFPSLPIFGLIGKNVDDWSSLGGIIQPAKESSSAKIEFNKNTKILDVYTATDGADPILNSYNYKHIGSTNLSSNNISSFKILILLNVWNVSVGENQIWVDNFQLSEGLVIESQNSTNLTNWETYQTNLVPRNIPKNFYRLKIIE
jgi:hypothetical protein